jgi:hypothetical protein
MATGRDPLPPEVLALVNRARQRARSIETNGGTDAEISEALAVAQDARAQVDSFKSSSFVSQNAINNALSTLNTAETSLNESLQFNAKLAAQPAPPATASQTASDDAAKGPNAPAAQQTSDNGRVTPPPDTSSPSNATPTATTDSGGGDSGTNAPVRTTEQTQATGPASNNGSAVAAPSAAAPGQAAAPAGQPKIATEAGTVTKDDAARPVSAATQTSATQDYTSIKIVPRANPLDSYYSYSYSISVYLITPKQYETMLRSKIKKLTDTFCCFKVVGQAPTPAGSKLAWGQTQMPPTTLTVDVIHFLATTFLLMLWY